MVDCTIDGSYAVFETAKPCKYVLLYKKISPIVPIAICGGVAVLMMAAFVVLRRIKNMEEVKKKKTYRNFTRSEKRLSMRMSNLCKRIRR